MSADTITNQLIDIFRKISEKDEVKESDQLVNDLRIDSFLFIRLVVEIERKLQIRFDNDMLSFEMFPTVADMNAYLQQKKRG
ncbi:acyl carrier protein [Paenibacillus athensensis]|nr:acyl carrier protein [Paenibacillus athensensis]MCD1259374.1 acyl carrier protein [Paenibacillus athensensis]